MDKELDVLVLARTEEMAREYGAALGAIERLRRDVKRTRSNRPLGEPDPDAHHDLVVVEIGQALDEAIADIEDYLMHRDPAAVIFALPERRRRHRHPPDFFTWINEIFFWHSITLRSAYQTSCTIIFLNGAKIINSTSPDSLL